MANSSPISSNRIHPAGEKSSSAFRRENGRYTRCVLLWKPCKAPDRAMLMNAFLFVPVGLSLPNVLPQKRILWQLRLRQHSCGSTSDGARWMM